MSKKPRLNAYQWAVFEVMKGGEWMSLTDIQSRIYYTFGKCYEITGISARFRQFRDYPLHYTAESMRQSNGIWLYRLTINEE